MARSDVKNKDKDEDEGDQASMVDMRGFRHGINMYDRGIRRDTRGCDGVNKNLESIKMKIL